MTTPGSYILMASIAGLILVLVLIFSLVGKSNRTEQKVAEERLKDDTIYIEQTGQKFKLDDLEKGLWLEEDHFTGPEDPLREVYENLTSVLEVLKSQEGFRKEDLSDRLYTELDDLYLLHKYHEWIYSNPYTFNIGNLLLIADDESSESHDVLVALKMEKADEHFLLLRQEALEGFSLNLVPEPSFRHDRYQLFAIETESTLTVVNQILSVLPNTAPINFEVKYDVLFMSFPLIDARKCAEGLNVIMERLQNKKL